MDRWNAELDQLQARAKVAEAETKAEYNSRIAELREKRDEITERLAKLESAGEDAWIDLKRGLDDALESLTEAIGDAKKRYSEAND